LKIEDVSLHVHLIRSSVIVISDEATTSVPVSPKFNVNHLIKWSVTFKKVTHK
jgi:hypothetical protein